MKEVTSKDIAGRAFLFAGLTAAMYFLHILSYNYEKKRGWVNKW